MIVIDTASPTPPSEQIRAQLAGFIRDGQLPEGQRLPSIRQVASDLRVAPGTVAKAYAELESAGLIESNRARGSRVRPQQKASPDLLDAAAELVTRARSAGLSQAAAVELVRSAWNRTSD